MTVDIDIKVDRAALLILLGEQDWPRSRIATQFNNLNELLGGLEQEVGLIINDSSDTIQLEESISFNLFQDVPPEVRDRVRDKVVAVEDEFFTYTNSTEINPIADLIKSDTDPTDIKDFRPVPPLATFWENRIDVPRAKDMYASRVCPEDSLQVREDGKMVIQDRRAPGLLLAAIKDPFNTLTFTADLEFQFERYELDDDQIEWVRGDKQTRREITQRNREQFEQPRRQLSVDEIQTILDTFEAQTGRSQRRWDQVPYYLFTRNCLRLLGMDARYTGAPGMKTRSDVTAYAPIYVTIEVKSPAESKINEKAVRQAFDSSVPFAAELDDEVYRAAVGADISGDAVDKAAMYRDAHGIKTPLIIGRVLLFLVLMNAHESLDQADLEYLFGELSGSVTASEIADLYRRHCSRHNDADLEKCLTFVERCL
jgi:hypothetical protein